MTTDFKDTSHGYDSVLNDDHWQAVLTVLAIAVIADHRVRDPEIIEFCHEAQRLSREFFPERILTRSALLSWFEAYKIGIDNKLLSGDVDSYIQDIIQGITVPKLRLQVLRSVFSICICDYELKDEESAVLQVLAKHWNMKPPVSDPEIFAE